MTLQPAAPPRSNTGSILQLILGLFGLGASGLAAALLLVIAVFAGRGSAGRGIEYVTLAWMAEFLALVSLPSIWFAARRLMGRETPSTPNRAFWVASTLLVFWLLALVLGSLFARNGGGWTQYLMPLLTILGVVLPVWWALELVQRGLARRAQRAWGILNFALFFSNPLALVLEIVFIILLAFAVGLAVSLSPSTLAQLQQFSEELRSVGGDLSRVQQLLAPFLSNPLVILAGISLFSIAVPMLEEAIKPLAVVFLLGRRLTPAEGMVAGAVAGAGFALTESLFNLANPALQSQWFGLIIGRTGTGLLHISTAALVGWGLASAWQSRRFWRLALAYLVAVAVHGLWNALNLFRALAALIFNSNFWERLVSIACLAGLVILAIAFVVFLWSANRRFQRGEAVSPAALVESL